MKKSKHAIKELKLAGYGNGEGGPNDWIYQQVIEAYYRSAYNVSKRRK